MTTEPARRGALAGVVLAVRFLSELALLAGLAWAGARLSGGGVLLSVASAVLWPLLAALIWGLTIAPKARRRLAEPTRFVMEFALFALAGFALAAAQVVVAGIVLAVAGIVIAAAVRVVAKDG